MFSSFSVSFKSWLKWEIIVIPDGRASGERKQARHGRE